MSAAPVARRPVPPDAVHVWRGYRAPGKSEAEFLEFLGSVFLPACALLQPGAGLHAFIPSVPASGAPAGVPDQTALMFWPSQDAYAAAFATPAVRAYTNLHGGAYGPASSAQFPIPLASALVPEQPYHLLSAPADWMLGAVRHFLGARAPGVSQEDFLSSLSGWAAGYAAGAPGVIDGALLCAGNDYVAFWEHWRSDAAGASPAEELPSLASAALWMTATATEAGGGLWDSWPGFELAAQSSLNVRLDRPAT